MPVSPIWRPAYRCDRGRFVAGRPQWTRYNHLMWQLDAGPQASSCAALPVGDGMSATILARTTTRTHHIRIGVMASRTMVAGQDEERLRRSETVADGTAG